MCDVRGPFLRAFQISSNKHERSGKEKLFAFAKSWLVAARQIGMSLPSTSALASRGGALAGLGSSDRVARHALGVTLTSLSPAVEC